MEGNKKGNRKGEADRRDMHKKNSAGPGDSVDGKQMLVLSKANVANVFFYSPVRLCWGRSKSRL